jgi:hypothetical protein
MITEAQTLTLWEKFKAIFADEQKAEITALTTARDAEKTRADKAAGDLAAMTTARDAAQAELGTRNSELATARAERDAAKAAQATADSKAVDEAAAKKAATLAAAAGQPPIPAQTGPSTPGATGDLLEQRAALTTPEEKAAFDKKHAQALFDLARSGIRKERAQSRA